jgi:hypothetical protein
MERTMIVAPQGQPIKLMQSSPRGLRVKATAAFFIR